MNDLARWQEGNERYLAAAMAWLRLRLARMAGPVVIEKSPAQSGRRLLGRKPSLPALPAPSEYATETEVAEAADEVAETEAIEPPPAPMEVTCIVVSCVRQRSIVG